MDKRYINNPSILITGGAGFVGSNFVLHFLNNYNRYNVIVLDNLTYAASLNNLSEVWDCVFFKFIKGDICNRDLIEFLFKEYDIRGVIHFAAESHVDNSILTPDIFIKTNVLGTLSLLDVSKRHWMLEPGVYKPGYEKCRFCHISTDEVYGSLGNEGIFTEESPYAPNSPYSASKASSDMIVRSYFKTYGLNVVTTNCSNNYGPKQHNEKLIPVIINRAINFQDIPIYGNGGNIRDWLYVGDHCSAIDLVFHKGKVGETYNIGGNNERPNIEIARIICDILDELIPPSPGQGGPQKYRDLIKFVEDRPGHDLRYAVDSTKIKNELGWEPREPFYRGLQKTISWYLGK